MIHARCLPTELLLERSAPALSHAERLRVEAHLLECERCRCDHGAMLDLLELVQDRVESVVKPSVHERAISRALLRSREENHEGAADVPRSARWSRTPAMKWALAAATLSMLLALGLGGRWRFAAPSAPVAVAGDHLVSGALSLNGSALRSGAGIPAGRELEVNGPFVVELAHAHLSVQAADSLMWSPAERAVTLRGGVVDVSVDPSRQQSFRVVTPHFMVDVLGTEFRVALDSVAVTRGRVRVLSTGGLPLTELGPGQSWSYTAPVDTTPVGKAAATRLEPDVTGPTGSVGKPQSGKAAAPVATVPAAELLAQARHRLAGGDAKGAVALVDAVLRGGASRAQQAEAFMLKGDCALVQGDAGSAARQYLDVSKRFAGSPTAETALFAAARIESNRGNQAAAGELLRTYLERYPSGQFASDVKARLRILEAR